jgi:predicted kinase
MFILRGPSGAGKTEYANSLINDNGGLEDFKLEWICSADKFFYNPDTRMYEFDPTKLGEAHAGCLGQVLQAIAENARMVFVDNTNIRNWEFQNYIEIGRQADYEVEVYQLLPETIEEMRSCVVRSRHDTPPEIIAKQILAFEKCEADFINVRNIGIPMGGFGFEPNL